MSERDAILIVDDQADFARGLARLIEREFPDIECLIAGGGEEALQILDATPVPLMLTDLRMPGLSGQELLDQAFALLPQLSVIMITGYGSIETAVDALKGGAYDFLTKPVDRESLIRAVSKAMERARLLDENRRLKKLVEQNTNSKTLLQGESTAMKRLRESVAAVAASDYTVLVTGESGTGKELVARTIHTQSKRSDGPLLTVNCPAIPGQLLESELFGHVKGAFTGADRDRKGLFASANGGTLLLDEIGDISMDIQTKLLRVLQEQEVRPVGTSNSIQVNVRIIASTNQDLKGKMRAGTFREDLFYRLNVLAIRVPQLAKRTEDIAHLAHHFLSETCREMRIPPKEIAPEVLAYLASRTWPGNVRELQNFMRRLAVFAQDETVSLSLARLADSRNETSEDQDLPPYKLAKATVVDDFTRTYIRQLLTATQGNISHAARASGLERVSLQKILKRLDIDADQFRKG